MREIRFYVWMPVKVVIGRPSGVPGEHYGITIGGYYYGTIVKRAGKWMAYLNPRAEKELTADDIEALGDWIDEAFPD
jgi:hypothetical protein